MTGNDLPEDGHVVRYARPSKVNEDGTVDGSEFRLRQDDTGLSINWLECFTGLAKAQQLDEVRRLSRLNMRTRGRLAELNVGVTKHHVRDSLNALRFIHGPLNAIDKYKADPSHSEMLGLPPGDSPEAELIGDMIAECIAALHPALL